MHFLYPSDPLRPKHVDDNYAAEFFAITAAGFGASVFSLEEFQAGSFKASPPLPAATVLYRGWMLAQADYESLVAAVSTAGAKCFVDTKSYLAAHHLPNWYPAVAEFSPETRIFSPTADLAAELRLLDWPAYFIKDYVKSLKTSIGSIISNPEEADVVATEMRRFRGTVEGGFCVRRVEGFLPETERRFFVFNSIPFSASGENPAIVATCARRIQSPFFSMDIVQRNDGVLRLVEIGDGQVSDLVGWSPEQFVSMFVQSPLDAREAPEFL